MKKIIIINFVATFLVFSSAHAWSRRGDNNSQPAQPLSNSVKVTSVNLSRNNAMAGSYPSAVSCEKFLGTHHNNILNVELTGTGGSGGYQHVVVYQIPRAYKLGIQDDGQKEVGLSGNGTIQIRLPELMDDVPFVQQTLFLVTTDASGKSVSSSITFTVSRTVILTMSNDRKTNCFERYLPYESITGVLSNATNNLSSIQIKQGLQKIWGSNGGRQFGISFSPLAMIGLGNLLSFNWGYFAQTSKQVIETTEVVSDHQFDPGDFMQVYVQPTRYVSAYDAAIVSPCGEMQKVEKAYMFQWWGMAYHVYPVNPRSGTQPPAEAIGAPVINTCPAELTPGSGKAYQFVPTNI
jgi:hypothetical protein